MLFLEELQSETSSDTVYLLSKYKYAAQLYQRMRVSFTGAILKMRRMYLMLGFRRIC